MTPAANDNRPVLIIHGAFRGVVITDARGNGGTLND